MKTDKDIILTEILSFIDGGDKTTESIDSFIIETKYPAHSGQGTKDLWERALIVEKEYTRYFKDVYATVKKYDLDKIEESAFKLEHIDEIRGGVSVVKGYIDIPSTDVIFESVKSLIISTKEKLRKLTEKINTKSDTPFRETKDDDTTYSFRIKERIFTFDKSTLQYQLIKYMVIKYNENIYYHRDAINYIKEKSPDWKGRLSSIIQNINDSNADKKFSLIKIIKKGKTFNFDNELFK